MRYNRDLGPTDWFLLTCFVLIALVATSGCTPLTEAQLADREYQRGITAEQYELCYSEVTRAGRMWVTVNDPAAGTKIRNKRRSTADMKAIMARNGCAPILRAHGYE